MVSRFAALLGSAWVLAGCGMQPALAPAVPPAAAVRDQAAPQGQDKAMKAIVRLLTPMAKPHVQDVSVVVRSLKAESRAVWQFEAIRSTVELVTGETRTEILKGRYSEREDRVILDAPVRTATAQETATNAIVRHLTPVPKPHVQEVTVAVRSMQQVAQTRWRFEAVRTTMLLATGDVLTETILGQLNHSTGAITVTSVQRV